MKKLMLLLICLLGCCSPLIAQVTDLSLGVPLDGSVGNGQSGFYRLELPAATHLVLTLQNHHGWSSHTMYIQQDVLPTPDNHLAGSWEGRPEQVIEIPELQAGTYYVMVRGSDTFFGAGYTILARTAEQLPALVPGEPLDDGVGNAQSRYYRLQHPSSAHLVLTLQNHHGWSSHTMYIQQDVLPTPDNHLAGSWEGRPEQVIEIPELQAGTYYVMVRGSDTFHGAGYTILARTAEQLPALVFGEPLDDGVGNAQSRYYRLLNPSSAHLLITLQNHHGWSSHSMYIQRDILPTPEYYLAASEKGAPEQLIELPNLEPGPYYVMVRGSDTFFGAGYTILATCLDCPPDDEPVALWASTYSGGPGIVTVRVWAVGLAQNARVMLTRDHGTTIEAQVTSEWEGYVAAQFDLTRAALGEYDLVAVNTDGREFIAPHPFVVEAKPVLRVEADIVGRSTVVAGRQYRYAVHVENTGNLDLATASILVYLSGHVGVSHNLLPLYPDRPIFPDPALRPDSEEGLLLILEIEDLAPGTTRAIPLRLSADEDYQIGVTALSAVPVDIAGFPVSYDGRANAMTLTRAQADCPDNLADYPPIWPYDIYDSKNPPPWGYVVIFTNYRGAVSVAVSLGDGKLAHHLPGAPSDKVEDISKLQGYIDAGDVIVMRPLGWYENMPLELDGPSGQRVPVGPGNDISWYKYVTHGEAIRICAHFVLDCVPGLKSAFGDWWLLYRGHFGKNSECIRCKELLGSPQEWKIWGTNNGPRIMMEFLRASWLTSYSDCFGQGRPGRPEDLEAVDKLRWNPSIPGMALVAGFRADVVGACSACWNSFRSKFVVTRRSIDPNVKEGPTGSGDVRFVGGGGCLPYMICFENAASATAAAQEVVITDQLDFNAFDADSFTLGEMGFGAETIEVPPGRQAYSTTLDLPGRGIKLEINAGLDRASGAVTWSFRSLDPETGELPEDPSVGFLPPNRTPPDGEGYVMFTIRQKPGLTTGTEIRNKANIVFDVNPTLETPEWVNTIDAGPPTSRVDALAETQAAAEFEVSWEGQDDTGGSGIRDYTIYVSTDGDEYEVWLANTADILSTFTGEPGHTYRFYSCATDNVGHVEPAPSKPDTATEVPQPVRYALTVTVTAGEGTVAPAGGSFDAGQTVTLTATPAPDWHVKAWTGVDSQDGNTAAVLMNADRAVTLEFEAEPQGPGRPMPPICGARGAGMADALMGSLAGLSFMQLRRRRRR